MAEPTERPGLPVDDRKPPGPRSGGLVLASVAIVAAMLLGSWALERSVGSRLDHPGADPVELARLQAFYMAEMELDDAMRAANEAPADAKHPFPVHLTPGALAGFDFTERVWLARPRAQGGGGEPGAVARCTLACTRATAGEASFRVEALLDLPDVGRFTRAVRFSARRDAKRRLWELASYEVEP